MSAKIKSILSLPACYRLFTRIVGGDVWRVHTREYIQPRAGEKVLVGLASANRDEEIYPSPDEFRLDRSNPAPQLSFGHGIHMCVGNGLARMEAEVLLDAFLDQFTPDQVRVTPDFELQLMPAPFMYGPVRVDIQAV